MVTLQWVDGAVLRPDAADKPLWMSDPHWALVAHLKQFVFTFQKVNTAEIWRGLIGTTGIATFFRFLAIGDTGTLSTSQKRVQGTVGLAGADLNFSNVNLVSGNYRVIGSLNLTLPLV